MTKKWKISAGALVAAVLISIVAWGPIASNVEQPEYQVVSSEGDIEIRRYAPIIIAEVTAQGDRDEAINNGFKLLADYIFGNNSSDGSIAMTAPVTQRQGREIAMTAPVTQQPAGKAWTIGFTTPSEYTLNTIPKPNNPEVSLRRVDERNMVAIRFSGMRTDSNVSSNQRELQTYIRRNSLVPLSDPIYAFYNPPLTLPFLRRNEILVEVKLP